MKPLAEELRVQADEVRAAFILTEQYAEHSGRDVAVVMQLLAGNSMAGKHLAESTYHRSRHVILTTKQ